MTDKWGPGPKSKWRRSDSALVGDKSFPLYYGEHPHGRRDDSLYVALHGDDGVVAFSGHRVCTRLDISEYNYATAGIAGPEVKQGCALRVYMNNRLVFGQFFRGAQAAAIWYAANEHVLFEHPVALWMGEGDEFPDLIGRKVWYRDEPGIISSYFADQGVVMIDHDPRGDRAGDGFEQMASLRDEFGDEFRDDVKDGLLSESISWHRGA